MSKKTIWVVIIISFLGMITSAYTNLLYYAGSEILCLHFQGYETILRSGHQLFFKIPYAFLSLIFCFLVFLFSLFYSETENIKILKIVSFFAILGFIPFIHFIYLHLFTLNFFCLQLLIPAIFSLILFIFGIIIIFKIRKLKTS